ncbi:hypothetical protein [Parasitella parasitica]|uniref:Uncharacterized protein n=1 Tax=Parasitella parasitica TaxID=35722 RepID=A0A0B7NGX5_9FUNG|nr:hypothetical protein [Parasitella parasitica]
MGFFNNKNLIFVPAVDPFAVPKTPTDPYYHRTQNAANNNLAHAMNLFEEKNKYPAVPVDGPLPIKANGAIVVNRPKLSQDPQDLESDDEEVCAQEQEEPGEEEEYTTTAEESSISDNTSSDASTSNAMHLVHEENHRLRQQILLEREQNEKYKLAKDQSDQELHLAKQRIKNLQRAADRFQKMLSVELETSSTNLQKLRRQSTGTRLSDTETLSVPSKEMVMSYEHKIQILLNEIEAMEQDEMESTKDATIQKNECDKLMRKIKSKDDIIRQLAYDLQYEKSLH